MVLASPLRPPPPPVDPDDSNSKNIQRISFKFYMRVDTPPPPWSTLLLNFDTILGLEQLCSQPNDTCIPQILQMQYLHK